LSKISSGNSAAIFKDNPKICWYNAHGTHHSYIEVFENMALVANALRACFANEALSTALASVTHFGIFKKRQRSRADVEACSLLPCFLLNRNASV
jgi:ABC-type spermidine/putrescine transport system permease subunit II